MTWGGLVGHPALPSVLLLLSLRNATHNSVSKSHSWHRGNIREIPSDISLSFKAPFLGFDYYFIYLICF